jgi:hypothetical protein
VLLLVNASFLPLLRCCLTRSSESLGSDRRWVSVARVLIRLLIEACKQPKHRTFYEICKPNSIYNIRSVVSSYSQYKRFDNSYARRVFSIVLRRQGHGRSMDFPMSRLLASKNVQVCFLCMTLAAEYHHNCVEKSVL